MAAPHSHSRRAMGASLAAKTAEYLTHLTPPVYIVNPTPPILHGVVGSLYQHEEAVPDETPLHEPSFSHQLPSYSQNKTDGDESGPAFRVLLEDDHDPEDSSFALSARLTDFEPEWVQINTTSKEPLETYITSTTNTAVPFTISCAGEVLQVESESMRARAVEVAEESWEAGTETTVEAPSWTATLTAIVDEAGLPLGQRFEELVTAAMQTQQPIHPVTLLVAAGCMEHTKLQTIQDAVVEGGLSSASTAQRRKTKLEDAGLLNVQYEPGARGRPHHRLYPGENLPDESAPEDVVTAVQTTLEER